MLLQRGRRGNEAKTPLEKLLLRVGIPIWFARGVAIAISLVLSLFVLVAISKRVVLGAAPAIDSLARRSYTEDQAPFFDESVPAYRARLAPMLQHVRPGHIFLSIASFRDNLCQDTLVDAFSKAARPDRVFVGLCDQRDLNDTTEDVPCIAKLPARWRTQVRLVEVPAEHGKGPTHARYIASKLWQGEALFVQVDSHTQFAAGWDATIAAMMARVPRPDRTVLTHYPVADPSQLGAQRVPWICEATHDQAPPGLIIQLPGSCHDANMSPGIAMAKDGSKTTCFSPFLGAGFFAGHASLLYDAPYDKYLFFLFHGEEFLIAARLWTSGWDLMTPAVNVVSHVYGGRDKNVFVQVPTWYVMARKSEARARHLLGAPIALDADPDYADFDRSELADLGVGHARPLSEYLEYAGVNLTSGNLTSRCGMQYDPARRQWLASPTTAA